MTRLKTISEFLVVKNGHHVVKITKNGKQNKTEIWTLDENEKSLMICAVEDFDRNTGGYVLSTENTTVIYGK